MNKDKALDLALEVLESERDKYLEWGDEDGAPDDVYEAITAIKQARSAPVPLTDQEHERLWEKQRQYHGGEPMKMAHMAYGKSIEAAHGITKGGAA
jgi:hypothetical protein